VALKAVLTRDLDSRFVEALPWLLSAYTDLNWEWLRDGAKLRNAQNRLGYPVHLAMEAVALCRSHDMRFRSCRDGRMSLNRPGSP